MVRITLYFATYLENFRSRYHTVLTILSFQELYISFDQKIFFLLQIFLKTTNQEQYGLTHNYHFTNIGPILSKAHLVQTTLQNLTKNSITDNMG